MVCTTALFPVTSETLTIKYENYEKLSCCFLENKVSTISSSCKDDPKIKISCTSFRIYDQCSKTSKTFLGNRSTALIKVLLHAKYVVWKSRSFYCLFLLNQMAECKQNMMLNHQLVKFLNLSLWPHQRKPSIAEIT